jgi:hypothetical protein
MHVTCAIGDDRRADVCLPARSVRLEIEERRTACFGILEERAASMIEVVSKEDNARASRPRHHVASIMSIRSHSGCADSGLERPQDLARKDGHAYSEPELCFIKDRATCSSRGWKH